MAEPPTGGDFGRIPAEVLSNPLADGFEGFETVATLAGVDSNLFCQGIIDGDKDRGRFFRAE